MKLPVREMDQAVQEQVHQERGQVHQVQVIHGIQVSLHSKSCTSTRNCDRNIEHLTF